MKKILLIGLPLVVLAVVAALVFLAHSLDGIVKGVIQDVGSDLLGTRVSVGSVSIDLREGRGTIRNLQVQNPEGFSSDDAFSLGEITVQIDLSSITSSPIVLDEVLVSEPDALAEITKAGLNLDVLRRHVGKSEGGGEAGKPKGGEGEPVRLRIRRFTFEKGEARFDATALGGKAESIALPGLSLSDVGGPRGETPDALGKTVLEAWLAQTARAAARHQARSAVGKALDDALGDDSQVGGALKGLLD